MELKEIRKIVTESENKEWLSAFNTTLKNPNIGLEILLTGVIKSSEFIKRQCEGYEKFEILPAEFQNIKTKYNSINTKIEDLLVREIVSDNEWRNIFSDFTNQPTSFNMYDSPETIFLIELHKSKPQLYQGAYEFIINRKVQNINSSEYFTGYVFASLFLNREYNLIKRALGNENRSFQELRRSIEEFIQQSGEHTNVYFSEIHEKSKSFANQIDELKNSKELLIQEWQESEKTRFDDLYKDSTFKINELKKTYEELLRLKEPAEYWKKRAEKLYKEGNSFRNLLIFLIVLTAISLYLLLWLTPEGMLLSFIKGQASAIKWSIIYATFISFMVVGIRALLKAMFSSYHLSRDAEEREQLTYFYLSLRKESEINDNDKSLIMQSLFSRSDTGLLKEDSAPTMPSNILDKIQK
ncbi:MAG: DUF6161 domain-containing protein [Bacteroidetes bacterium]|nr:DUF6161 domain-containing protein [Bacteroidota bacterium]